MEGHDAATKNQITDLLGDDADALLSYTAKGFNKDGNASQFTPFAFT